MHIFFCPLDLILGHFSVEDGKASYDSRWPVMGIMRKTNTHWSVHNWLQMPMKDMTGVTNTS